MLQKVMTLTQSNLKEFIHEIEIKYGKTVAKNMVNDLLQLTTIARYNDYLNELNSPRFVVKFTLHPITGKLIIETINDQHRGYRYTLLHGEIHKKSVKYI